MARLVTRMRLAPGTEAVWWTALVSMEAAVMDWRTRIPEAAVITEADTTEAVITVKHSEAGN